MRKFRKYKPFFTNLLIFLVLLAALFFFLNKEFRSNIPSWENNLSLEELIKLHKYTLPKAPEGYVSIGTFKLTAYCPCEKCCGVWGENRPSDENGKIVITASGERAEQGLTVAADTDLLPFGTALIIDGKKYIVQDRGGAIKKKRLDIYFENHEQARSFGVQYREVYIKIE